LAVVAQRVILHPSCFVPLPLAIAAALALALSGCGTLASRDATPPPPVATTPPPTPSPAPPPAPGSARPGGYYLDDGPGANPPADIDGIPDAVPRAEPLHRAAMRPYSVLGRSYTPMTELAPYKARGLATWYGRRYHGKRTAIGEVYDMYAMTAAHPTLPLPSYARVTHLKTGRSIVVRVNDRGPFHEGRIIDLSYTAAHRLGILSGATPVEVESILPGAPAVVTAAAPPPASGAQPAPVREPAAPRFSVISPAAAEPLPAPVVTAPPAPAASGPGRVVLQLGAFASRENAESYLARLRAQADWLTLQVFSSDGLHRVQAGPYANESDARQVAERLGESLGIKALVLGR
jgi:rare lipoprotein A